MALRVTWKSHDARRSARCTDSAMLMDAQEDVLQDVVRVRLAADPARDEGAQTVAKLRPELLGVAVSRYLA